MKATITIGMDNAAFDNKPATELARILRDLAEKIEIVGGGERKLYDFNGNNVGKFKITGKAVS